jgi:hypothetical protein
MTRENAGLRGREGLSQRAKAKVKAKMNKKITNIEKNACKVLSAVI